MYLYDILTDIHALEEELLDFERKYGIRSETFYAAYAGGEEPEDDRWALDFGEWGSIYRTWLTRQAEYRNELENVRKYLYLHSLIQEINELIEKMQKRPNQNVPPSFVATQAY